MLTRFSDMRNWVPFLNDKKFSNMGFGERMHSQFSTY